MLGDDRKWRTLHGRGCRQTCPIKAHVIVLEFQGPSRRERLLNAGSDGPAETAVIELRDVPRKAGKAFIPEFVVVGDLAAIALSGHPCLDVAQRAALRAKRVADTSGP